MSDSLELLLGRPVDHDAWQAPLLASASFCAVHRREIYPYPPGKDHTLDENPLLESGLPLDNYPYGLLEPEFDLGDLDQLPSELLEGVLAQTDLESLTRFRSVNQKAMQLVNGLSQYRAILQHSPQLLRGALATGVGSFISCQAAFDTLTTAACESCQDFAGYIYLPSCRRVCFLCFSKDDKYLPLLPMEVEHKLGIDSSLLANVPHIWRVPGCYTPMKLACPDRGVLFDSESSEQVAIHHFGSAAAMQRHVDNGEDKRGEVHRAQTARCPRARADNHIRSGEFPVLNGDSDDPRRFVAIVRAPWLNLKTKQATRGFHCLGCRDEDSENRALHNRRKFSEEKFEEHLQEWGPIQWHPYVHPSEPSRFRHLKAP